MDINEIKLVIWDLDETFWHGVLSEGTTELVDANVKLVKDLIDCGVQCSICSKNDKETVRSVLETNGIWDLFVFKSINWSPKGERVKQIVSEMGLREVNVLYLDDNSSNRAEVQSSCPNITVEDENYISKLVDYYKVAEKKDIKHERLKQYKLLEKKRDFKATVGSNEEFLAQSNINVEIHSDCLQHLERIGDLISRSNQLNFTKKRDSKTDLKTIILDSNVNTGYVTVKDNFGEYGIVGFFAIRGDKCIHYTFSCRVLNMGIEQFVYKKLGKPRISIIGDVSSDLNNPNPYWINTNKDRLCIDGNDNLKMEDKLIIKGPCDMEQILSYISASKNIEAELTYVSKNGVSIEGRNHTTHIIQSITLNESAKKKLICELPFGDDKMYMTKIFAPSVGAVVLSTLTDPHLGLYKDKETGGIVAFGEYTNNLTDESIWDLILEKKIYLANCVFDYKSLQFIKSNYEFIGRLSPNQVLDNLKIVFSNLGPYTTLILSLGSEMPFLKNNVKAYDDRHIFHQQLNSLIREWALEEKRVKCLDVNKYINGQECFTNNINHYTRKVYYQMSCELTNILSQSGNDKYKNVSIIRREVLNYKRKLKRKLGIERR